MKSFGDLFGQTLKEYGDKFVSILKISLLFYVLPLFIFGIILSIVFLISIGAAYFSGVISQNFISQLTANPLAAAWHFGSLIGLAAALFVIIFVLTLAFVTFTFFMTLSYYYIAFSNKKEITVKEAFNQGVKKYFWKYTWFTIVSCILLALLFALLIVPGIIFLVYWIFGSFILIKENKGIMDSLKRSKEIVKGKWWTVFGYGLLMVIIAAAVSAVGSLIPIIGFIVAPLVVTPFIIIFLKNMYLDMASSRKADAVAKPKARKKR